MAMPDEQPDDQDKAQGPVLESTDKVPATPPAAAESSDISDEQLEQVAGGDSFFAYNSGFTGGVRVASGDST